MTPNTQAHQAALLAARTAHHRREASNNEYRQAIQQATRAGATYSDIARTLGITRQAVRQYAITN